MNNNLQIPRTSDDLDAMFWDQYYDIFLKSPEYKKYSSIYDWSLNEGKVHLADFATETKKEVIPAPVYKHTEGVWIAENNEVYALDKSICFCNKSSSNITKEEGEANAEHIVRCCNSFPVLVDALEKCKSLLENFEIRGDCIRAVNEALKNAAQ